jgi:hypothetical protein
MGKKPTAAQTKLYKEMKKYTDGYAILIDMEIDSTRYGPVERGACISGGVDSATQDGASCFFMESDVGSLILSSFQSYLMSPEQFA